MQDRSVQKLFNQDFQKYSGKKQSAKNSPLIGYFLNWAKEKGKRNLKICEFGGAGGGLLAKIGSLANFPVDLYNVEIIQKYQKYQASSKIKFFNRTILNSHFPDNSFDVLIIRDVLHHLIGRNLKETFHNQDLAIEELARLIKPKGIILIEELVNCSQLASRMIYLFSKMNSHLGIRIKGFQISPYTIISFLSPPELLKKIEKIFGQKSIQKKKFQPTNIAWQSRLVHLGARAGKMILMIEKR